MEPRDDSSDSAASPAGTGPVGRDACLVLPPGLTAFLKKTITEAGGNEVYFLGRVQWQEDAAGSRTAELTEIDVVARGNRGAVPAVMERAEDWDVAIHNHPSGHLEPSEADLGIAHELSTRSVGFAIISNDASRVYLVIPPFVRRETRRVEEAEIRHLLGPEGPLARALDGYEVRQGQVEMALEVTRALNEDRVVAAEAGTGIGKSFAYLIPSILWATRNDQKVVVSTGTIHLQEQLVGKDLPLLARVLEPKFRYALMKGRSNYACRRKTEEVVEELRSEAFAPNFPDKKPLEDLVEWAKEDPVGSRAQLGWVPPSWAWEMIKSETDKSLKVNCPHYQRCVFYQAKREAFRANVLVVNPHLFFADLAVRRETENYEYDLILPAYRRVVFDEAHHLEDVASEHLGVRFSRRGIQFRLGRHCGKGGRRGTVPRLCEKLRGYGDAVAADSITRAFSVFSEITAEVRRELTEIEERLAEEVQSGVFRSLARTPGGADSDVSQTVPVQARYVNQVETRDFWEFVCGRLRGVLDQLAHVARINDRAAFSLKNSTVNDERRAVLLLEVTSFAGRLEGLIHEIERFASLEGDTSVYWLSSRDVFELSEDSDVAFQAAPVRVAHDLRSAVYLPIPTVVLTSATLCVDGKLDFLGDRLGLDRLEDRGFRLERFASPFDFSRQVLTVVPTDLPEPSVPGFEARLANAVFDLVCATRGGAFVLFTSFSLLKRTHRALADRLTARGLRVLAQGEAERSMLMDRFRSSTNGVLFGTDSFWEGVDVKGASLECVVITKLPFRVPSEPLQQARVEELEKRGVNPFMAFTVPQAVLKFRQGFGRLIRSTQDRGVVAVLDNRILTKRYGRIFRDSLPKTRMATAPLDQCVVAVEDFFSRVHPPA